MRSAGQRPLDRTPFIRDSVPALDAAVTCLAALVSGCVGLVLPGITEDYDAPSSDALPFYALSAFLAVSLVATTRMVRSTWRPVLARTGFVLSAWRLGLLAAAGVAYLVRGTLTYVF